MKLLAARILVIGGVLAGSVVLAAWVGFRIFRNLGLWP